MRMPGDEVVAQPHILTNHASTRRSQQTYGPGSRRWAGIWAVSTRTNGC
jgi:hypothetical protein